jgi:hypothetical protein
MDTRLSVGYILRMANDIDHDILLAETILDLIEDITPAKID